MPLDFDDFIELEEFIAKHPREPYLDDATGERKYLQEMELFFVRHGYRDDPLHIQATDYAFLVAFGKLFKARYAAGEDSVVVRAAGALLRVLGSCRQLSDLSSVSLFRFLAGPVCGQKLPLRRYVQQDFPFPQVLCLHGQALGFIGT